MEARDIINYARDLKKHLGTNDPYVIAEHFGVEITAMSEHYADGTAQTLKLPGMPTIISISERFSKYSQKVLCAHELGHALFHDNSLNHFKTTSANVRTAREYEANLFAVALLCDDDIEDKLCLPLESMNNYLLKTILDFNIYE